MRTRRWMVLEACALAGSAAMAFGEDAPGAAYTMTNAPGGNAVMVYQRSASGALTPVGPVPTGGAGTGAGLGNQGGVTLSRNDRWLLVVNAGSNDVSVFDADHRGIRLTDRVPSGGAMPVSVTIHGNLVYVLNGGSPNTVAGFRLSHDGRLTPIAGSIRTLSAPQTGPAQVQFSPDGDLLAVTEKATNRILTFQVLHNGLLSQNPVITPSNGATPFGFSFGKRGQVFVSEAFGGAPDASAVSSYEALGNGSLRLITGSAPTTETAACWVAVSNDGRFAYTTNTGSGSITGYRISPQGSLSILNGDGRTAVSDAGPIDLAFSGNGRFLYSLNGAGRTITAYRVSADGSLQPLGGVPAPPAANGLAVR